jgi:SAM-dependent methyltransferase
MDSADPTVDLTRGDAYGRSFADVYDRWYDGVTDAAATARFVSARAGDRPVVELGAGSGRLAAAIARHGHGVIGLDASTAMLGRSPAADRMMPVCGDMRALPLRGPFGLVLIAFNTIFNLSGPREQAGLFRELADGFDPFSSLVVETLDLSALADGPDRAIGLRSRHDNGLVVTATELDRSDQTLVGQHFEITDSQVVVRPWRLRWLTLDQLDELAGEAGLALTERHRSWGGDEPGQPGGDTAISVYRLR